MPRCEKCNRKLKHMNWRFCGNLECTANEDQIIPRCIMCGNLFVENNSCPSTGSRCTGGPDVLPVPYADIVKRV